MFYRRRNRLPLGGGRCRILWLPFGVVLVLLFRLAFCLICRLVREVRSFVGSLVI